jgi:LysR family hydrogen peroxide-inducible transcriptional activator
MNLQQLHYIIAVDKLKNFVKASEACFVTQATLSMMIKKLEEELEVKLFDRTRQPVKTTAIGEKIISQAKKIISESKKMKELIDDEKGIINGEMKVGIIPTLAPYLLPLFLKQFLQSFPLVKLVINEFTTDVIIQKLKNGDLDAALLATPLRENSLNEQVLFYEKYFLYVNQKEKGFDKQFVLPKDIDVNRLWLLEEGHCMRSQILNFCSLKKQKEVEEQFHYNAGSIETLKNMVDTNFGMTIIPELATHNLSSLQKKRLRSFKTPVPVREISLVTHREFLKATLVQCLKDSIMNVIPKHMLDHKHLAILEI